MVEIGQVCCQTSPVSTDRNSQRLLHGTRVRASLTFQLSLYTRWFWVPWISKLKTSSFKVREPPSQYTSPGAGRRYPTPSSSMSSSQGRPMAGGSGAMGKVAVEGCEFVLGWTFMVEPLRLELGRRKASGLAPRTG